MFTAFEEFSMSITSKHVGKQQHVNYRENMGNMGKQQANYWQTHGENNNMSITGKHMGKQQHVNY